VATPNLATASNVSPGVLVSAQLADGWTHVLTVGAGQAIQVSQGVIANSSAGPVAVSVAVARAGDDPTDGTHSIAAEFPLAAGDALILTEGETALLKDLWLGEGDQIAVGVDVAAAVTVVLSGLTIVG
jgi:hypothetical protein